ncbi:hypothetical protein LINPERHAP2_LOCUS914 [Linum perenne]
MIRTVLLTRSSYRPWRTSEFLDLEERLGLPCLEMA